MLFLPDSAILLDRAAADWRAAVLVAGEALEAGGMTTAEYGPRMVAMVEEFGAYIVIAPGLALAHARPGDDVLSSGMSVATFAEPVVFGHPYNDPVSVVIGLAVITADEHVNGIAELANVFNEPSAISRIAAAQTVGDVQVVFRALTTESPGSVLPQFTAHCSAACCCSSLHSRSEGEYRRRGADWWSVT